MEDPFGCVSQFGHPHTFEDHPCNTIYKHMEHSLLNGNRAQAKNKHQVGKFVGLIIKHSKLTLII